MNFSDRFPLRPGTKIPACKWSQPWNGPPIPPDAPHGVPTGPRNGVWVVDLDLKEGKDGEQALQAYADATGEEWPETYTVQTPSGGWHLYFMWEKDRVIGNRTDVLPGVDVRGVGGYVCAGGEYRVTLDITPVIAPDWLYGLVSTKSDDAPPGDPVNAITPEHPDWTARCTEAARFLDKAQPCVSGSGGQKRLWEVCLRLSRTYELPPEQSWAIFAARYNRLCLPPWDKADVIRTLERAAALGTGPTGTFAGTSPLLTQKVPAPLSSSDEPWRQRPDPEHRYLFELATEVIGGDNKLQTFSQKQLAAVLTGPNVASEWRGVWQYNRFKRRIVAVNPPLPLEAETIGLTNIDLNRMVIWYQCKGVKCSTEILRGAIEVAASEAAFHPIEDYFDDLPPCDSKSASAFFHGIAGRLWGASPERDAYESDSLKRLAIAAVRRIRRPGTRVDTMLVLQGDQAFNKSRFCDKLFGEYFRDQMPDLGTKEASIALDGYWGIEFAEFAALRRSGANIKKDFLTRCVDRFRPVWGADTLEVPRQCVFIGTTNEDDFLDDPTGSRRYAVCVINRKIDLSFDRDQFWAAANALEASGGPHWADFDDLPDDQKSAATPQHNEEESWAGMVIAYAKGQFEGQGYTTASDALRYGVGVPIEKHDAKALTRVKAVLRFAFGPSKVMWVDNRAVRVYRDNKQG